MCVETTGVYFVHIVQDAAKNRYYRTDRKRVNAKGRGIGSGQHDWGRGEKYAPSLDFPLTNGGRGAMLSMKREYQFKCSPVRSQAGEIIENRVQITNGTATVSVEVSA